MTNQTSTRVFSTRSAPLKVGAHTAPKLSAEDKAARDNFVNTEMEADKVERLRAERKAIDDSLKNALATMRATRKAAQADQPSKLEREIARQEKPPQWMVPWLAGLVARRVQYGQPESEALAAVVAMFKERIASGYAALLAEQAAQAAIPAEPVSSK